MPTILSLNGSPIKHSSTEILLNHIVEGISAKASEPVTHHAVRLNDYAIMPCQSCGVSPEPDYCLYHDDLYPVYDLLINCDVVLFGSPIYFDTVSAQSKLFIDRCNCLRPPDFAETSGHHFKRIIEKKRCGGIVLVGGPRQKYECARTVIAGFFKWINVENVGNVIFAGSGWEAGAVRNDRNSLDTARQLGLNLAIHIRD